jgi:hypothetical protein
LKKAQITAVGTMDDRCPLVTLGNKAQKNDPDVSQTSSDHQPAQTLWFIDMAFVQVKAPTFLIREKGFGSCIGQVQKVW